MSGLLDDLPNIGLLSGTRLTSAGVAKLYVPTKPTAPPPGQAIQADPTHILVRALDRKKAAGGGGKTKASADPGETAAKRAKLAAELNATPLTEQSVRDLNVAQLKAACSSRGLTMGGKKEEIIARLITHLRSTGAGPSSAQ
jgi:hypothetical protein